MPASLSAGESADQPWELGELGNRVPRHKVDFLQRERENNGRNLADQTPTPAPYILRSVTFRNNASFRYIRTAIAHGCGYFSDIMYSMGEVARLAHHRSSSGLEPTDDNIA